MSQKVTREPADTDRGRNAQKPLEISKLGWKDVLVRVMENNSNDNLSLISSGVAFYWFLAIFPALAAAVSIYGMVFDPEQLTSHLEAISRLAPQQAYEIIQDQFRSVVTSSGGALGIGIIMGILVSLWSATRGMKALMTALNIAYNEKEERSFLKLTGLALLLTLGSIVFGLVSLAAVTALPALLGVFGLPDSLRFAISMGRWPLLALLIILALGVIYRYAPDRSPAKWRWISFGAIFATLLWIIGSIAFSFYVSNFGNYNEIYGSIGAIIILLLWFFLSAYAVLLGAELNAELEHQTKADSTKGEEEPMGQRGADMADTLGGAR